MKSRPQKDSLRSQTAALRVRQTSDSICLPSQITSSVPACALSCVQSFIRNNYNKLDCGSTSNLQFLCTTKTKSGLTIGEGDLQCVVSSCWQADLNSLGGLNVCSGIKNAVPNMAGTITATITAQASSTPASDGAGAGAADSTTSQNVQITSDTVTTLVMPTTSPVSTEAAPVTTATTPATTPVTFASSTVPTTVLSMTTSTAVTMTSPSRSTALTAAATAPSSSSSTDAGSAASTSTGQAAVAEQKRLSSSAVAGIATAGVVAGCLLIAFLAYLFFVKRKKKEDRRKGQRISGLFPPHNDDKAPQPDVEYVPRQSAALGTPQKRFYSGEATSEKTKSFWRRSFMPADKIGVAVAGSPGYTIRDSGTLVENIHRSPNETAATKEMSLGGRRNSRWSIATSINEDMEAQDQELPALAARPASSRVSRVAGINNAVANVDEKPRSRQNVSPPARVQLTPTYDNGNFDSSAFFSPVKPLRTMRSSRPISFARTSTQPIRNFSRRVTAQGEARPIFDLKPPAPTATRDSGLSFMNLKLKRQDSTWTYKTISIHTDIDEDTTPEQEDDKQLATLQPLRFNGESNLRDVQYPRIPRSSAIRQQAEYPHSPRAKSQIKSVGGLMDAQGPSSVRDQLIKLRQSFLRTNTSSTYDARSDVTESPVFPLPPNMASTRPQSTKLSRKISRAVRKASDLTLMQRQDSFTSSSLADGSSQNPFSPGPSYESPRQSSVILPYTPELLNAQRMSFRAVQQEQRPPFERSEPQNLLLRATSTKAKFQPRPSENGDLYLMVHDDGI